MAEDQLAGGLASSAVKMLTHEENSSLSAEVPHFQLAWDSTSLGELKLCPRKYQLRILYGYASRDLSVHLKFGLGFHGATERYDHARAQGADHEEGVRAAVKWAMEFTWDQRMGRPWISTDPNKNRYNLVRTVVWYYMQYEHDPLQTVILENGKPAVELSFMLPLPFKSEAGEQLFYGGHMDRIASMSGGEYVVDKKSTKSTLSKDYFAQYSPDNQFSGYIFAGLTAFKRPLQGLICDAAQVLVGGTRFSREIISRTPSQIKEWVKDLAFWLRQAEFYAKQGHWPMNDKACVTGDTIVTVTRGKRKSWKMTINQLHDLIHSKQNRLDRSLDTYLLSEKNGLVVNDKMLDVFATGVKPVFRLKTRTGSIKATADHQFLTKNGWKRLDQINIGDVLLHWNGRGFWLGRGSSSKRARIGRLYFYPNGYTQSHSTGQRRHKLGAVQRVSVLTVEARMNGLELDEFVRILRTDPKRAKQLHYLSKDMEVHHKDGDSSNDNPDNLVALTSKDHHAEHDMKKAVNKIRTTVVTGKEFLGEELVYDIAMEGEQHNFIANGLVAHNCHVYGGCAFRSVCGKTPEVREQWLRAGFERQIWNPLVARGDI